jgi:hypothetical protein
VKDVVTWLYFILAQCSSGKTSEWASHADAHRVAGMKIRTLLLKSLRHEVMCCSLCSTVQLQHFWIRAAQGGRSRHQVTVRSRGRRRLSIMEVSRVIHSVSVAFQVGVCRTRRG